MANVKFENISKVFDNKKVAVDNISFEIFDKEFVVLVGPSGCGKSTTLRMIAGLEELTSGKIYIDGKCVNDVQPKDRDIAMVFQNYALYPHMTVFENMAFGLKIRKMEKSEIKKQVEKAAEILDLQDLLNRRPKQLSGGQRQRVAVGRALVRDPKVFLFDEPLSNLDAKLRVQMRTEISKLHKKLQATMVYVTHDQTEAMTMGDRIVVMKDGIIHQIDTPLGMYNHPANLFVAGFIGSPSMNFMRGKVNKETQLQFVINDNAGIINLPDSYSTSLDYYIDRELIMGVRPEDIIEAQNNESDLEVTVDVVEPMGNEIFIYYKIEEAQMISRLHPSVSVKPFEKIKLHLNRANLHFFDIETELNVV